jgi:hypothetical protein
MIPAARQFGENQAANVVEAVYGVLVAEYGR